MIDSAGAAKSGTAHDRPQGDSRAQSPATRAGLPSAVTGLAGGALLLPVMGAGDPPDAGAHAPRLDAPVDWAPGALFPLAEARPRRSSPETPGADAPRLADPARRAPRRARASEDRRSSPGAPAPADWRAWLAEPEIITRYRALVWRPAPDTPGADTACWPWLGAVSDTGHGSFKIRSPRTVNAHALGYQIECGVIERRGVDPSHDLVLCHGCDEPGCQRSGPGHMELGTVARNTLEYKRRQGHGPLADLRGPQGRTRAIAAAVRQGLAAGEPDATILARIAAAKAAGEPGALF